MDNFGERLIAIEVYCSTILEDVQKIKLFLGGNGEPGFKIRVDRLERDAERRKWGLRAVAGALLALAGRWLVS